MLEISVAAAIPVALWFVAWFYRKAIRAEMSLVGYKYNPPKTGGGK